MFLCITNNSIKHRSFVYTQLNDQTVLFQTIRFCISHFFALSLNAQQLYLSYRYDSIRCNRPGSEWTWGWGQWRSTPHSPNFSINRTSPSDCFMSLGECLTFSVEIQSVYSKALTDWVWVDESCVLCSCLYLPMSSDFWRDCPVRRKVIVFNFSS